MNLKSLKISTALIAMLATTSAFASFQSDEEGEVAKTRTTGKAGKKGGQARQPKHTGSKKSATAAQDEEIGEHIGDVSPFFSRLSAQPRRLNVEGDLDDAQGHASFVELNASFLGGFVRDEESFVEGEVGSEDKALSGLKSARKDLLEAHELDSDDEALSDLKSAKEKLSTVRKESKDVSGSSSSSSGDAEVSFNEEGYSPRGFEDERENAKEHFVKQYAALQSQFDQEKIDEEAYLKYAAEIADAEEKALNGINAKEAEAIENEKAKVKALGKKVAKKAAKEAAKIAEAKVDGEEVPAEDLLDDSAKGTEGKGKSAKTAPVKKTVPTLTAPVKPAPAKTAPVKPAPVKTAPVLTAPTKKTAPVLTASTKVIPTPKWASMPQNTEGAMTYGMHDSLKELPVLSHSLASKPNATVISQSLKAMTQSVDYTAEAFKKAYGKTATETKVTAAVVLTNVIKKALDVTKSHALPMLDGKKDFEGRFQADATKALEFNKSFAQATAMNFAHTIKAVQKSDKSVDYIIWNTNGNCAFATLNFKKVA